MGNVNVTYLYSENAYIVVRWDLDAKEKGDPVGLRDYGRATFQVEGGAVEIRGSIIGGRFDILTDRSGMPLVIANNIMTSDDDVAEVQPCNLSDEPAIVAMIARR